MEKRVQILWVDDEIDLLKPYIFFLEDKGYKIVTASNGYDALDIVQEDFFDLVLLDENMPGLTGLEVLLQIKELYPLLPVTMITKSEEEDIMEQAIGSKIADYLIKPVNPKQILMSIKRVVDQKRLVGEKTTSLYQAEFSKLGCQINDCRSFSDWEEIYRKLVYWDLELEASGINTMREILEMQKTEANNLFGRFVKKNYLSWLAESNVEDKPILSPAILKEKFFSKIEEGEKYVMILLDNLRFDQWRSLYSLINRVYKIEEETLFSSILPTATQYARNAMFAGLMPRDIDDILPDYWVNDDEDEGKNLYEEELLRKQIARLMPEKSLYYEKVLNSRGEQKVKNALSSILENDISVLVYNFVDILSHSRTENKTLRELASDEVSYRSIVKSWFEHSYLFKTIKELAARNVKLIVTTDHGCIRVQDPVKVQGDKEVNTNLRYKQGKNLNYNPKEVFEITDPKAGKLPQVNVSSKYIFSTNVDFFAYPNNFNYYSSYYKDTFQHGGISLEEMLVPFVMLSPK